MVFWWVVGFLFIFGRYQGMKKASGSFIKNLYEHVSLCNIFQRGWKMLNGVRTIEDMKIYEYCIFWNEFFLGKILVGCEGFMEFTEVDSKFKKISYVYKNNHIFPWKWINIFLILFSKLLKNIYIISSLKKWQTVCCIPHNCQTK